MTWSVVEERRPVTARDAPLATMDLAVLILLVVSASKEDELLVFGFSKMLIIEYLEKVWICAQKLHLWL